MNSKTAYELLILVPEKKKIISYFNNSKVYGEDKYISLMTLVNRANNPPKDYLNSVVARDFYNFHKSILDTYRLIDEGLFQSDDLRESLKSESFEKATEEGYLIFETQSEFNIGFNEYATIVGSISNLVSSYYSFR